MSATFTSVLREATLGLVSVRMSKVAFHLDYVVFPPIALWLQWKATLALGWQVATAMFLSGLVGWTFAEYVLHRYALHHWPYFSAQHMAHHREPRAMIGAPTLFSVGFFTLAAFLPAWLLLGRDLAFGWYAGFLVGYVAFCAVHQMVHHSSSNSAALRYFKRLHALHHHGDSNRNFGVITSFWDHVFGTYEQVPRRRKS
jgi:sterol desaturase/sphingolipid hydroxylase (fatty acid hydroxylase superfamily)